MFVSFEIEIRYFNGLNDKQIETFEKENKDTS